MLQYLSKAYTDFVTDCKVYRKQVFKLTQTFKKERSRHNVYNTYLNNNFQFFFIIADHFRIFMVLGPMEMFPPWLSLTKLKKGCVFFVGSCLRVQNIAIFYLTSYFERMSNIFERTLFEKMALPDCSKQ